MLMRWFQRMVLFMLKRLGKLLRGNSVERVSEVTPEFTPEEASGMRSEREVKAQLKQIRFRHLQELIRKNFHRLPENCVHNAPANLDKEAICWCILDKAKVVGRVCDKRTWGGAEQAENCPYWDTRQTKEQIKADFQELQDAPLGKLASVYPDIAALLWVLR